MNTPLALPCVFCSPDYATINVVSSRGKTSEENQFLPHGKANGAFAHSVLSKEGLSLAERWAVDAFLAWDDPTSTPLPSRPTRNAPFIPMREAQGLSGAAFGKKT